MNQNLTLSRFDAEIGRAVIFSTQERGTKLILLIKKWNEHIKNNPSKDKFLHIDWIDFQEEGPNSQIDLSLSNIKLKDFRLHKENQFYLYLHNSEIGSLKFSDSQNSLNQKVIQGDGVSLIKKLEFDNIHFENIETESLIIFNVNIKEFRIIRTVNQSEKIQILGCHIESLIVSSSDLGKMLLIENAIDNLYIIGSAAYRLVLLSNKIGSLQRTINRIDGIPPDAPDLSDEASAGVCRQLKNAFDESKNFADGDRFYADEMYYTMRSLSLTNSRKYLLALHWLSSNFGTSWIRSGFFIIVLGLIKTLCGSIAEKAIKEPYISFQDFINNVNPYANFSEAKNMAPVQLAYLVLLSYGIYQFVLATRRSSKR